jgi:hypothetical protein
MRSLSLFPVKRRFLFSRLTHSSRSLPDALHIHFTTTTTSPYSRPPNRSRAVHSLLSLGRKSRFLHALMLCLPLQTRPSGAECLSVDTADHAVESCSTSGFYSDFFAFAARGGYPLYLSSHYIHAVVPILGPPDQVFSALRLRFTQLRSVWWLRISRPFPDDPISPLNARDANTARLPLF